LGQIYSKQRTYTKNGSVSASMNKIGLTEIGWGGMHWIDLAQDRGQWRALVTMVINLVVPRKVGKFVSSRVPGEFSTRAQL
jgi:hypothetical protein